MRGKVGELRNLGSIAYDMAMVAMGVTQYAITTGPHLWDVAGGLAVAAEAGAQVTLGRRERHLLGLAREDAMGARGLAGAFMALRRDDHARAAPVGDAGGGRQPGADRAGHGQSCAPVPRPRCGCGGGGATGVGAANLHRKYQMSSRPAVLLCRRLSAANVYVTLISYIVTRLNG